MRDFRKLLAWQKADDLAVTVYRATKHFPSAEKFGLISQLRRAAVSVAANIAEGSGRHTLKDFRRFLYMARGSLSEVQYYVHLAGRLDYLPKQHKQKAIAQCTETGKTLQGLINSLTQQMKSGRKYN
jgi:four helix bundle protein